MYSEKDLEKITEIFISNVRGIQKLFLFGSYARGTAGKESDIDIAVIVDTQPIGTERRLLLNTLYKILGKNGYMVDIIFKPEKEFNLDKSIPVTMAHTIVNEGKVLWTKKKD